MSGIIAMNKSQEEWKERKTFILFDTRLLHLLPYIHTYIHLSYIYCILLPSSSFFCLSLLPAFGMANAYDIQSGITVGSVEAKWLVAINAIGDDPPPPRSYLHIYIYPPTTLVNYLTYLLFESRLIIITIHCDDVVVVYLQIIPAYLP